MPNVLKCRKLYGWSIFFNESYLYKLVGVFYAKKKFISYFIDVVCIQ